jgi:metal-responsive CopG/Arc/MetJ family transcriptional regulator
MKVKTSITLSADLLKAIDQCSERYKNRSEFIEAASWALLKKIIRDTQNAKDLEILNRRAEALNREAVDVLTYQVAV